MTQRTYRQLIENPCSNCGAEAGRPCFSREGYSFGPAEGEALWPETRPMMVHSERGGASYQRSADPERVVMEKACAEEEDEKLFELAAKAAGHDIDTSRGKIDGGYPIGIDVEGGYEAIWNPRDDDGDCLRLATALEMGIDTHCNDKMVSARDIYLRAPCQVIEWGDNRQAAVRTAVFLLAVEIGKVTP